MKFLFKKISLASDHAGFVLKESIKKKLIKQKVKVFDLGPTTKDSVDYPDYAKKVARNISSKESKFLQPSRKFCLERDLESPSPDPRGAKKKKVHPLY